MRVYSLIGVRRQRRFILAAREEERRRKGFGRLFRRHTPVTKQLKKLTKHTRPADMLYLIPALLLAAAFWYAKPFLTGFPREGRNRRLLFAALGLLLLVFLLRGQYALSALAAAGAALTKLAGAPAVKMCMRYGIAFLPAALRARKKAEAAHKAEAGANKDIREAARLLRISEQADEAEIRAAYTAYMKHAHPDKGGTDAAAKEGAKARDILLAHSAKRSANAGRKDC